MKVLSLILARGGSKRLPNKNILELAGKPLIAWSIEASLSSKCVSRTIVSSDDDRILSIAESYGAETVIRPEHLATDIASSEEAMMHAVKSIGGNFDYIVLLQPTSPLRTSTNIDNAFGAMLNTGATGLISVYECDNSILKAFTINNDGFLNGIHSNKVPFMRKQDLPATYMSNGAIYIIKADYFLQTGQLYSEYTIPYLMSSSESIDIDTAEDLERACEYIKEKN